MVGGKYPTALSGVFDYRQVMLRWFLKTGGMMSEQDNNKQHKLELLKIEHRDLDDIIEKLISSGNIDQLQMQRLKKRKLFLKDLISGIESDTIPDIIA